MYILEITVNGQSRAVPVGLKTTLLEVLRDRSPFFQATDRSLAVSVGVSLYYACRR